MGVMCFIEFVSYMIFFQLVRHRTSTALIATKIANAKTTRIVIPWKGPALANRASLVEPALRNAQTENSAKTVHNRAAVSKMPNVITLPVNVSAPKDSKEIDARKSAPTDSRGRIARFCANAAMGPLVIRRLGNAFVLLDLRYIYWWYSDAGFEAHKLIFIDGIKWYLGSFLLHPFNFILYL